MDSPTLNLAGFEVIYSPTCISTPCINLGEFEEDASPLQETFCNNMMSQAQYNAEGSTETEKALKGLIEHIEKDQSAMLKLLQRRKQEEIDNSGIVALLKSRFMKKVQGDRYKRKLVTEEECMNRVEELSQGMMMVYNYTQESRGFRQSKRLAAKRGVYVYEDHTPLRSLPSPKRRTHRKENIQRNSTIPSPPPPPLPCTSCSVKTAPPPVPAPHLTPLKDRNIMLNSPTVEQLKRPPIRNCSTGSLVSVHEELLASNPLQRLRVVKQVRSPGGTPIKKKCHGFNTSSGSVDLSTPCALKNQEPLTQVFLRILEQKFRNIRSPSPAPSPVNNSAFSPGEFTP